MRRVFLAGQVTSIMGDGLALLAIPLLVLQMTGNPLLAAFAAAARSAGYFVVGIPAGPLADRLDATRVVGVADTVRFVIFAVLGVLAWLQAGQVWIVLVLACVSACASVFFDASLAIVVQDLFPASGCWARRPPPGVLDLRDRTGQCNRRGVVPVAAAPA